MSPSSSDLTINIRAEDYATPVIRRLRRELWWTKNGERIIGFLIGAATLAVGFLAGHLT